MPSKRRCCCHVTGQDCTRPSALLVFQIVSRLLLAMHFFRELVWNLYSWSTVVQQLTDGNIPQPDVVLAALVALLCVGSPLLLGGIFMRWTAGLLVVYQIAATSVVDSSNWPFAVSVIGGVLLAVATDELQRKEAPAPCCCGGGGGQPLSRGRPRGGSLDGDDGLGDEMLLDPLSEEAARFGENTTAAAGGAKANGSGKQPDYRSESSSAGRNRVLSDRPDEVIV
jgi:uncharacterized membrane protein YphA (DoxX/SURF4 family)